MYYRHLDSARPSDDLVFPATADVCPFGYCCRARMAGFVQQGNVPAIWAMKINVRECNTRVSTPNGKGNLVFTYRTKSNACGSGLRDLRNGERCRRIGERDLRIGDRDLACCTGDRGGAWFRGGECNCRDLPAYILLYSHEDFNMSIALGPVLSRGGDDAPGDPLPMHAFCRCIKGDGVPASSFVDKLNNLRYSSMTSVVGAIPGNGP